MSKKVLILSGSPRRGGNSDFLCDTFMKGAQDAGAAVTVLREATASRFPVNKLAPLRAELKARGIRYL